MLFRILLSLSVVFTLSTTMQAQIIKSFSEEPSQFLTELGEYMNRSKQEKLELCFKNFKENYESGAFSQEQKDGIYQMCNNMIKRKMSANYFLTYLTVVDKVKQAKKLEDKFEEFNLFSERVLSNVKGRKAKYFQKYLEFVGDFYTKNSIRKTATADWKVTSDSYEFDYKEKEFLVKFEALDLYGVRKNDSISIKNTSGIYDIFKGVWKGQGGEVSWERLKMSDVVASLGTYEFELKKNAFICEDATLVFPKYFGERSIEGVLEDRVIVQSQSSRPTYPRFQSKDNVLTIDNIGADIQYTGGFTLKGATLYGTGSDDNPANLKITKSETGEMLMNANSTQFLIKEDEGRIVGEGTEIALYFGEDSLYHPSINFRLETNEKYLTMRRGERGSDRNPFFDSYHNIRLDADKIDWDLNGDTIVIGKEKRGTGEANDKVAYFESYHYFNEQEYMLIQNISSTHPVATIMNFSRKQGTEVLDAEAVAEKLNPGFGLSSVNSLLYALVAQGFIEYDSDKKLIYVKDKLRHYADASVDKEDYDNIKIQSKTTETNAYLYLDDENENPLDIRDVGYVEISPKLQVAFKPMGKQIMMKKNRNMDFRGKVFAGLSTMQGKDFKFDYNAYAIQMDSINYFDLFENSGELDANHKPVAYPISSRIEGVSGALLIDSPDNKSSIEEIELFPSFSSVGNSYVYYDSPSLFDGVYKRDSFYYKLDEFGFDNLDGYMPEDIQFEGEMFTFDIFAPFRQDLFLVEKDKSLGFEHEIDGSYEAYIRDTRSGQGLFSGKILLSNSGLEGKGVIDYLAASIYSNDIVFQPKLAKCSAKNFDLEESRGDDPELPQVEGTDVKVTWQPYLDSLYITPDAIPFKMFREDMHMLDGTLIFTPGGLRGNGLLDWDQATMKSDDFLFGAFSVEADTTSLKIKAVGDTDELALSSPNVKARVDFDSGKGTFKSNLNILSTKMPYNKYMTSMDEFTWDMDRQFVAFKSEVGRLDEFLAPELDPRRFQGETAEYDIANSTLKIGGVPFIKSADALIYPKVGDVEIKAGGTMKTLKNAKILASDKTKYHAINRATVNIKNGKEYRASGFYEYNVGERKQEFELTNIVGAPVGKGKRSQKTLATRGSGSVVAKDDFYVDHKTRFKGKISLSSEDKDLLFEGYAKLELDFPQKNWFSVKSKADKNNLAIAYRKPKDELGEPLKTGIFVDQITGSAYPTVMGRLLDRKDRALMDVEGVFKYNQTDDMFIFGDSTKLTIGSYKGNVFEVDAQTKNCKATGKFDIGDGVYFFKPTVAGRAELSADKESATKDLKLDVLAGISYQLPKKALDIMKKDLSENMFDVASIELPVKYNKLVPEVVGAFVDSKKAYKQVMNNFKSSQKVNLPAKGAPLFFFSYLPMKWNPMMNSLLSSREKVGLAQVDGKIVNKMVEAYVEFRMPGNMEDGMHLYIKNPSAMGGGHFYYFKYKEGILQTCSSNPAYNTAIAKAKKKERIIKMGKGEIYTIEPISAVSAELFINRVKKG